MSRPETLHLRSTNAKDCRCQVCGTVLGPESRFTFREAAHIAQAGLQPCKASPLPVVIAPARRSVVAR